MSYMVLSGKKKLLLKQKAMKLMKQERQNLLKYLLIVVYYLNLRMEF